MTEAPKDTDADLYRASAVMIREGGTHPGFLCLSATHLAFRSAAEGGSAGQELWQAALDTVDETILDVGSQLLVLAIGGEEFSFLGEELEGLHLRMRDLLDADESLRLDPEFAQTAPITRPDYEEQPERVLLDGTLQRFVNNWIATRGTLHLTTRIFRFEAEGGLDRSLWGDQDLELDLSAIESVRLEGLRRRLVITAAGTTCFFGGPLITRLYSILVALLGESSEGLMTTSSILNWKGVLVRKPVGVRGELVITDSRISFCTAGRLEALFGVSADLNLDLSGLERITLKGRLDRRLLLQTAEEVATFRLPRAEELFGALCQRLLSVNDPVDVGLPEEGTGEFAENTQRLLASWGPKLLSPDRTDLRWFGRALHMGRSPSARRGWLVLTARVIVFVPAAGPRGNERPLVLPIENAARENAPEVPPDELWISARRASLRFIPRGGQDFVDTFWVRWEAAVAALQGTGTGPDEGPELNRREAYRTPTPRSSGVKAETCLVEPGRDEASLRTKIHDFSRMGCCIFLDRDLPTGTEVLVDVGTDEAEAQARGSVVYSLPQRMNWWRHGVSFDSSEADEDGPLHRFAMALQREWLSASTENELEAIDKESRS